MRIISMYIYIVISILARCRSSRQRTMLNAFDRYIYMRPGVHVVIRTSHSTKKGVGNDYAYIFLDSDTNYKVRI